MRATTRRAKRAGSGPAREMRVRRVELWAVVWAVAIGLFAGLLYVLACPTVVGWIEEELVPGEDRVEQVRNAVIKPTNAAAVAEIVPAVVVAIFIFAVGTQFVIAQVVPQARGTRAVEVLRSRHLETTLSPALALIPLAVLTLVMDESWAWSFAAALLLGSVVYVVLSTERLLRSIDEATNPIRFRELLSKRHNKALATLTGETRWRRQQRAARAVNELYDVVRTLRGWARSAATTGDSRELQIALEGTLLLVDDYQRRVPCRDRQGVPSEYIDSARDWASSPLRPELRRWRPVDGDMEPWEYWVPPPLVLPTYELKEGSTRTAERNNWPHERPGPAYELEEFERKASEQNGKSTGLAEASEERLAKVWVANEIGRSLVRSVEFASTTKTLLDRDRARLLLTLEKCARRFAEGPWADSNRSDVGRTVEPDPASAGVIVAYLVELGLGVRRCGPAELDWHFEPLARLAVLHRYFQKLQPGSPSNASSLVIGSGAAVLKVTEAIAMARIAEHLNQRDGFGWDQEVLKKKWGRGRTCAGNDRDVERIAEQTVDDLRRLDDVTMAFTVDQRRYRKASALDVAGTEVLEPRDQDDTRPTDPIVLNIVSRGLESPGRS